jgi:PPM family protein phosphatase
VSTLIDKLLGRQRLRTEEKKPPSEEKNALVEKVKPISKHLFWTYGQFQSIGRQRDHNEEALFIFSGYLVHKDQQSFAGFFAVADGMGGHANGEIASSLAVQTMGRHVIEKIFNEPGLLSDELDSDAIKEILADSIQAANQTIKKEVPGGGTTLTAILIYHQLYILHVGDSRAYLIPVSGEIKVLTHDHSFVRQLVDLGQISPEEALTHPQRNVLSMALGQWDPLAPDIFTTPIPSNGHLLICSDGLWSVVPEGKLVELIRNSVSPQQACEDLVQAANDAGGPDNITAILISLP